MKILVLGGNGQLGQCLYDQLSDTQYEVLYTSRLQIDIANFETTKNKLLEINPNIVVNAAAYTAVDKAEEEHQAADLINNRAVANIASLCNQLNCWLIHVSTDYVFDGNSNLPYTENDQTNPQGVYGQSKLKGEIAIQSSGCKYFIIRTAWVYSEHGKNFLKTMLRLSTQKNELRIVGDQVGCPTYAQDIARTIKVMIRSLELQEASSCLYHFSGNVSCSWAEFAQKIFEEAIKLEVIATKPNVIPIRSQEFLTLAKRPARSELSSNKIRLALDIDPSDFMHGIRASLMAIKNGVH